MCRGRRWGGESSLGMTWGITLGTAGVAVITHSGGLIIGCTLGGAAVWGMRVVTLLGCTLGGVWICAGCCHGAAVFFVVVGCICLLVVAGAPVVGSKILANCRSTCTCDSAIVAKGAAGWGWSSADVSSEAASRAASAKSVVSMADWYGKKSTVQAIRSDLVFVMYTRWHW